MKKKILELRARLSRRKKLNPTDQIVKDYEVRQKAYHLAQIAHAVKQGRKGYEIGKEVAKAAGLSDHRAQAAVGAGQTAVESYFKAKPYKVVANDIDFEYTRKLLSGASHKQALKHAAKEGAYSLGKHHAAAYVAKVANAHISAAVSHGLTKLLPHVELVNETKAQVTAYAPRLVAGISGKIIYHKAYNGIDKIRSKIRNRKRR